MSALRAGLALVAAAVLAGCDSGAASYQIGGSMDHALTLIREQRWFWDKTSTVELVVARYPDCQRRHRLNSRPAGSRRAELYQIGPQSFLLANGTYWYAIDQASCNLQPVAEPREDARGIPLGAFDARDGKLRFAAP